MGNDYRRQELGIDPASPFTRRAALRRRRVERAALRSEARQELDDDPLRRKLFTRQSITTMLRRMEEENAVLDDLERGPYDDTGRLIPHPIKDNLGNTIGRVFNFRPIPLPPGSTAHLYTAQYTHPQLKAPINVVVKFGVGESDPNDRPGDSRGVAQRNIGAYEAMDYKILQNGQSQGEYGPLLHYIPRGNLPNAPGDVLILENVGMETFGFKMAKDNKQERAEIRSRFLHALHDLEKAYDIDHPTLYYPRHTEGILRKACETAFGKDGQPAWIGKFLSAELKALASYFSKHQLQIPLYYSYATLRECKIRGDTIPLILKRILEPKMKIVPVSKKIPLRTFPLTLEEVGTAALEIALEMKNREPKRKILQTFEKEYLDLLELSRQWYPEAHLASVRRVRDILVASLADLDEKAKRWKSEHGRLPLSDLSDISSIRSSISNIIRRISKIRIENICSPWASFCGFDLNPDNVVIRESERPDEVKHFQAIVRRRIHESMRASMPGPKMVPTVDPDGSRFLAPPRTASGRLVFFDMWPPQEYGMAGSPVIALSFMLYKSETTLPQQDSVFVRQWLRRVMEDAGERMGLSYGQINCQRRLETARGRTYSALKFSQDPNPDWRMIHGLIDQCHDEIMDYEDPEMAREWEERKRAKWTRYKKRKKRQRDKWGH